MKQVQVHFHLAYVSNDRFEFTLTASNQPTNPMIEIMSASDLLKSIRGMKPGSKIIRIGKQTIHANVGMPLDSLCAYFKKVYDGYIQAKADGRDLDAELRELKNHPDPTNGSAGFLLQLRKIE